MRRLIIIMNEQTEVTMDDVAAAAEVSRKTVSRVINNRGGVGEATIQRVRSVMTQLGYDVVLGDTRRGPKPKDNSRTHLVAFVSTLLDSMLRSNIYHDLSLAVEDALSENGYGMIIRRLPEDAIAFPEQVNIDGMVVLTGNREMLRDSLKPCVQILGSPQARESWDHVTYDDYQVGVLAAEHLLRDNHSRIALLCPGPRPERARHQGFIDTITAQTEVPPVTLAGPDLYQRTEKVHAIQLEVLVERLDMLLAQSPRPTGIFVDADMITAALYPLLYSRGIIPGRDLHIVSCNNETATLACLSPRPPSIDINIGTIARTAVDKLLHRLDHPHEPPATTIYQPALRQMNARNISRLD